MEYSTLIDQLSISDLYPHPVEVITTIETHISIVFLTGRFAYKLKKPVDFGFLDFSTLSQRKKFCELEVQLNRRTAPDIYLDVCPIYQQNGQLSFSAVSQNDQPVDYLVKMNQFDPNLVLGRYLKDSELTPLQIEKLAHSIACFHNQAESAHDEIAFGHPDDVIHPMLDNFPSLLQTFDHPEIRYRLRQLAEWTHYTQKQLYQTLLTRKQEGNIKSCHGDMHLDNITLLNGEPTLFDGIEFNDQFRWIDVMNDLAFLLIDLDHRQQPKMKRLIRSLYLSETGDYAGLQVLKFYQTYRAMVRSKITALRYHQLDPNSYEALDCWETSLQYLKQAEQYAYELPMPKIILMQGIAGSGKSHYARQLLTFVDGIIISSDIERKRLYGIDPLHRVSDNEKSALYSDEMNQKTYETLYELTELIVKQGYSVIVDATFLKFQHREVFMELGEKLNAPCKLVSIEPDIDIIRKNIESRVEANSNPSDADTSIMVRQADVIEPPSPQEDAYRLQPMQPIDAENFKIWLDRSL
ncbi:MAG: AAA family ATPase [Hydrogenovibrio sp.]|nr:AAA family ATPase [Hydrogenovibrio sp.]